MKLAEQNGDPYHDGEYQFVSQTSNERRHAMWGPDHLAQIDKELSDLFERCRTGPTNTG